MAKLIPERRMNGMVAGIAARDPEFDAAAVRVKREIEAEASLHSDTGNFADSFSISEDMYGGVADRIIESDDPAALSIEFGHLTRKGKTGGRRQFVPGKFVVTQVVDRYR